MIERRFFFNCSFIRQMKYYLPISEIERRTSCSTFVMYFCMTDHGIVIIFRRFLILMQLGSIIFILKQNNIMNIWKNRILFFISKLAQFYIYFCITKVDLFLFYIIYRFMNI